GGGRHMFRRAGRLVFILTALVVTSGGLTAGTAHAQTPVDSTCDQASPSAAACIFAEKTAEAAAAECRRLGLPESDCTLPLGHQVSTEIVNAYQGSWLHKAAGFQYALGDGLPLGRAQWL